MPTHNQITSRKQKRHVVHPDQDTPRTPKPHSRLDSVTQAKASSTAQSTAGTTDTHDTASVFEILVLYSLNHHDRKADALMEEMKLLWNRPSGVECSCV